ncbi:MAG: HTH domain-containing protein [Synergistaceae bacterium]|nr:HTH domain-containing protein [Synergistaceae bacterium]
METVLSEPSITQKRLAGQTGLSVRIVAREIKNLQDSNAIRRIGSDRKSYWEIIKGGAGG